MRAFSDLSNADFFGANLSGSNFNYANLSNANFKFALLRGADLSDADFSDADLSDALTFDIKQIKSSKNWEKAKYREDRRKELGLPPEK